MVSIIHKKQFGVNGVALLLVSILSGCTTLPPLQPINTQESSPLSNSANTTATSVDAIKRLEINLIRSKADHLALFAPSHFAMVNKTLNEAQALIAQGAEKKLISEKIAVAKTMIYSGDKVKSKVETLLEKQFSIKKRLDTLKTNIAYQTEYNSMIHRLKRVIQGIEENNTLHAQNTHEQLLTDMQSLELRTIQYQALHEPSEIIQRIKYQNGEKLAPTTFQDAIAVYRRAERFIKENPNSKIGAERVGREALFAAKRALYITNQVSSLIQKVEFSLEQVVLDEEYRLHRVARELNSPDLRDSPLEIQSEKLALFAREKSSVHAKQNQLMTHLNHSLTKAKTNISALRTSKQIEIEAKIETGKKHVENVLLKKEIQSLKENLLLTQAKFEASQQRLSIIAQENVRLSHSTNNSQYRPSAQRPNYAPPPATIQPSNNEAFRNIFVDASD